MERVYVPLRRTYDIFKEKFGYCTDDETLFQMAIKALNDIVGPNGLVLTFLVFGTYLRINQNFLPLPNIV
jgi:hypothetical protein